MDKLTIQARPHAFSYQPNTSALIVIDMQRDFIDSGGFGESLGNDVSRLQKIIPAVKRLINGFRGAGITIIHTRECHLPDLSDCPDAKRYRGNPGLRIGDPGPMGRLLVKGEPGVEIIPTLAPIPGEKVIDKPGKGAFYHTDLQEFLQDQHIETLFFAGVTTEVCVQSTMREANDRGYFCLLARDATESYFDVFKQTTIDMIEAQGAIVGWTATVDDILTSFHA